MTEVVVPLPGYRVPEPQGEPVSDVVALAESILDKAKAGELVGLAVAGVVRRGGESQSQWASSTGWEFRAGALPNLVLAMRVLAARMDDYVNGKD